MRNILASLLPVPLLLPLTSLSAQAPLPLEPGARVRITAPGCGAENQAATYNHRLSLRSNFTTGPVGISVERTRWHRGTRPVPRISDGCDRRQ